MVDEMKEEVESVLETLRPQLMQVHAGTLDDVNPDITQTNSE